MTFPTEISHYNRTHESEDIKYFVDNITLSEMFSDFYNTYEQQATHWFYCEAFHTKFKISLKTRAGMCNICVSFKKKLLHSNL